MNGEIVKKFKFYAIWSDDKIEQWLNDMAKQGLHLQSVNLFNRYTFVRDEPADVSYQLDFMTKLDRSGEYYGLFIDAGWEHVIEFTGWQYWRKSYINGKPPEIFTDVESKLKKFQRVLTVFAVCHLPLIPLFASPKIFNTIQEQQPFGENVIFTSLGIILTMNLYFLAKLTLRIQRLKRDRK